MIVMMVMSFLVFILSWGFMGLEVVMVVGFSDFCFNLDFYVLNLI